MDVCKKKSINYNKWLIICKGNEGDDGGKCFLIFIARSITTRFLVWLGN